MDHPNARSLWRVSSTGESYSQLTTQRSVDLVIIGGGYTGCSAALHAAEAGASVVLLEANLIGHGGSGRNVGLVNAGLWLSPEQVDSALGQQAGERLNDALRDAPKTVFSIVRSQNLDCDADQIGTLQCAHSAKGFKTLESRARQLNARGGPVQILCAKQAQRRVGTDRIAGALFDPSAGTIHPLKYCRGLAMAAHREGAELYENSPVNRFEPSPEGWTVTTQNGASVTAKALLLATNGYPENAALTQRKIFTPVNYFQFATRPIGANLRGEVLRGGEGCWDTAQVMSSYRFDAEGRLIVGSVGAIDGLGIRSAWAKRKLRHLFPEFVDVPVDYAWHGTIAMTSDHLPKIVRLGENAVSIFGYSGRGIGPGTIFGKAAANALLNEDDKAWPIDPIETYAETMVWAKTIFFQWGASAALSLDARI